MALFISFGMRQHNLVLPWSISWNTRGRERARGHHKRGNPNTLLVSLTDHLDDVDLVAFEVVGNLFSDRSLEFALELRFSAALPDVK